MINRYIFKTHRTRWEKLGDHFAAIIIGLALAVGALAYFDVLTK